MAFVYISSFTMFNFQNSKYFEMPLLMTFSIEFEASLPQIGWNGTRFGTPLCSLGQPWLLNFHNQISRPSMSHLLTTPCTTSLATQKIHKYAYMYVWLTYKGHPSNNHKPKIWNKKLLILIGGWTTILAKPYKFLSSLLTHLFCSFNFFDK
jgi:hypothetical protein